MTHVMLDLETWGTEPGCDIRSIGAVVFDIDTGYIGDGPEEIFYVNTAPAPEWTLLTRDPSTVDWWSKQSPAARERLETDQCHIVLALARFADWWAGLPGEPRLWANGPHFDEAILAACYRAVGQKVPWHYRAPRDCRTIWDAAGGVELPFEGTEHNALDDAKHQARCVIEAYRRIRSPRGSPRRYEVWNEPTKQGVEAFKWNPRLVASCDNLEDAQEARHLEVCDEPAPDAHEYRTIALRSVFV